MSLTLQHFAELLDRTPAMPGAVEKGRRFAKSLGIAQNQRMRASEAVAFHRSRIRQIALSHRVSEVRVFGSAARGEDTDSSDIDFLVEPTDETTLLDLGAIRAELKALLGREVDVLTPGALPESFRAKVLSEARLV